MWDLIFLNYVLVWFLIWILSYLIKRFLFKNLSLLFSFFIATIMGFIAYELYFKILTNFTSIEISEIASMSMNLFVMSSIFSFISL